jgi:orotate phosphoribosyltransferase-like protein
MYDEKTVLRFIELRSQGWPFSKIAAELNVSKPTLINWSRKHQFQIQNLRAVELEALADKWLSSVSDRVNSLGEQLTKVEAELATRDVKDLSTPPALFPRLQAAPPNRAKRRPTPVHLACH